MIKLIDLGQTDVAKRRTLEAARENVSSCLKSYQFSPVQCISDNVMMIINMQSVQQTGQQFTTLCKGKG